MERSILLLSCIVLELACGGDAGPSVEQSIAKAMTIEDRDAKQRAELEAQQQAELKAKLAERQREQSERDAELDAAAQLPEQLPADVASACDAMVDAYDDFMKRGPEKDALLWYEGRRKKLAERRAACITQASVSVGACQARALMAELPTLARIERTEAANLVFARCADKFGKT